MIREISDDGTRQTYSIESKKKETRNKQKEMGDENRKRIHGRMHAARKKKLRKNPAQPSFSLTPTPVPNGPPYRFHRYRLEHVCILFGLGKRGVGRNGGRRGRSNSGTRRLPFFTLPFDY